MVEAARGPMLAVTDPAVKKITIMGPTQLMKTEFINNVVGFFMHQDPSPLIVMQPTGKLAEAWSKDRLSKMIRDTPALTALVKTKKSRDSDNTILHKSFPGGHVTIVSSGSTSDLAMRPVRVTLRDEIDKYESSKEGDPSKLLAERSATFWNALDIGVCSPTIDGASAIQAEYAESDMREYNVACPDCGYLHIMKWSQVRWDNDDPLTARYECPECKSEWYDSKRVKAVSNGVYVATAPFTGHAGFHVNKLASPWEPLAKIVKKWLEAQKDTDKLRTFVNTQLAECWMEKGEAPEYKRLYERREPYKIGTCPEGVCFLTAGVDVQKTYLQYEVVGWGKNKESWSIEKGVFMGETSGSAPWLELDKLLERNWTLSSGTDTQIRVLSADSGYNTQSVYDWARKYPGNRVMVIKGNGDENLQTILGSPSAADVKVDGSKLKRGVRVWPLGVSVLKGELYGFLNKDAAGDDGIYPTGFCHFPQYDEEFFKQLTAEQLVMRKVNSKTVHKWVKKYERNEALDCRNYARAAAEMIGMSRFTDEDWVTLLGKIKEELAVEVKTPKRNFDEEELERKRSVKKSIW